MASVTPPVEEHVFAESIRSPLTFILISSTLSSFLIPTIIILFALSNRDSRRLLIFKLNIFICFIGLLESTLIITLQWKTIFSTYGAVRPSLSVAAFTIILTTPLLVDSVLLVRILAFYPRLQTRWSTRLAVLAVPLSAKAARCVMLILWLRQFYLKDEEMGDSISNALRTSWYRNVYLGTEWTLQIVDNTYASLFFLRKLNFFNKEWRMRWSRKHPSILRRIRYLFYIALGNFVFPVILNIVQIALISFDRSFLVGTYVVCVNGYVSIFGVVFATVWTSSWRYNENNASTTLDRDTIASFWNRDLLEEGHFEQGERDRASLVANVCKDTCSCTSEMHTHDSSPMSSKSTLSDEGGKQRDVEVGATMCKLGYGPGIASSMRDLSVVAVYARSSTS